MAYVREVHVKTANRRQGLGRRMMGEIKATARAASAHGIMLTMHKRNPNKKFYVATEFLATNLAPERANYRILMHLF